MQQSELDIRWSLDPELYAKRHWHGYNQLELGIHKVIMPVTTYYISMSHIDTG